jgi:ParB family chromosome partitioning protein
MKSKKKALGRGLEAILQSPDTDITSKDISGNYVVGAIAEIETDKIEANPFQPRTQFSEDRIRELSDSIKEQGIIQPLTVRKMGYEKYQLIAGERRLKAARLAGFENVPCFIRVANDEQMLEMALIENIHRQDLNPIEIAISFQRLLEECNLTQEKLSERVGKKRATVSNYIRLLKLPPDIQLALKNDKISMGHARALINIEDEAVQLKLLQKIILNDLSVRQVEQYASRVSSDNNTKEKVVPEKFIVANQLLSNNFDCDVKITTNNNGRGNIVIPFKSEKDFDRILKRLKLEDYESKK